MEELATVTERSRFTPLFGHPWRAHCQRRRRSLKIRTPHPSKCLHFKPLRSIHLAPTVPRQSCIVLRPMVRAQLWEALASVPTLVECRSGLVAQAEGSCNPLCGGDVRIHVLGSMPAARIHVCEWTSLHRDLHLQNSWVHR